ncbi:hypothetical protein BDZ94DRAFT_1254442 [Collybia nuda]|uniref:Uncharacterized protein n=1 Tax=Collybia nuda TaxID=64659 RepID=A0A9P6CK83_9AGAR|nr:hypothetical protein BDZ94DRAFT_1254442 [Collybia nuda]
MIFDTRYYSAPWKPGDVSSGGPSWVRIGSYRGKLDRLGKVGSTRAGDVHSRTRRDKLGSGEVEKRIRSVSWVLD